MARKLLFPLSGTTTIVDSNFSTKYFYSKIKQLAKNRNWGVGNNALNMDRNRIIIRRFEIKLYKEIFEENFTGVNKASLRYKYDNFIFDRIKEFIPHIIDSNTIIIFYDDIKNDNMSLYEFR